MKVPLEEFVPYDKSVRYKLHEAFYRLSGGEAWTEGRIPFYASSNYAIARQHASVVLQVVAELARARRLGPREKVWLLEVGSGNGTFAANFLRALEVGAGEAGVKLLKRLRYVMSDVSAQAVRDSIASGPLAARVEDGVLVPAIFDLENPQAITDLDGKPIDKPFAVMLTNYVCCVAPLKIVKQAGQEHFERYVRLELEVPDDLPKGEAAPDRLLERLLVDPTGADQMTKHSVAMAWRPVKLEKLIPGTIHGDVVKRTLEPFHEATLAYPYVFFDCLAALKPRMLKGGAMMVSDYGYSDEDGIPDRDDRSPQHYGNALNFPVEFAMFDAAAPLLGLSVARSRDPLASVHVAVLRNQPALPKGFEAAVEDAYMARTDGEDLVDFGAAARAHFAAGDYKQAARMWQRCLKLDPENVEYLYKTGEACVEGQLNRLAASWLEQGARLDVDGRHDFQFQLGRAYYRLHRYAKAIDAYEASIEREAHPVAYSNLGAAYEAIADWETAKESYRKALAMDPNHERALERMKELAAK